MKPHLGQTLVVVFLLLFAASALFAGTVTLNLNRVGPRTISNYPGGKWEFEGGTLLKGATTLGNYTLVRRVVNGGMPNTAMLTLTLFFPGRPPLTIAGRPPQTIPGRAPQTIIRNYPPQNITLQGAHDFVSEEFIGSVSAASWQFFFTRDGDFSGWFSGTTRANGTLNISWAGGPATLP